MSQDFFGEYLQYTSGGEVPICFHRWSAILAVAAILERNVSLQFGDGFVYPNMYTMLIGTAGTKKSTAIRRAKKLLIKAGYTHIAAERTSKEKYLQDLSMASDASSEGDDVLERNIFGNTVSDAMVTPNFIAADEANDFFGIGNIEFLSVLGSLWDWEGKYENKTKNGKSDFIANPTISILSGNTPTGFAAGFPSSIFGQGFFSRLLLVYAEPTGERITIPRTPTVEETESIIRRLQQIKQHCMGVYGFGKGAFELVDKIYNSQQAHEDGRFESYMNRRLTHFLKMCLVVSCARMEKEISETSVLQANTYLRYVERLMPRALGEFGKAKNSDVVHRVLQIIEQKFPVTLKEIFREVSSELEKPSDIQVILQKLSMADKIQSLPSGVFLPKKGVDEIEDEEKQGMVDFARFLTPQELGVRR